MRRIEFVGSTDRDRNVRWVSGVKPAPTLLLEAAAFFGALAIFWFGVWVVSHPAVRRFLNW